MVVVGNGCECSVGDLSEECGNIVVPSCLLVSGPESVSELNERLVVVVHDLLYLVVSEGAAESVGAKHDDVVVV